jgi:serpin B
MQKMGIQKALSKSQADFSGMLEVPNKNVFINSALQKSHIELDKNGIKAAAATSIMIDATTSLPQERPKKEIWLDSSFAFVILDRGAIDGNVLNIPLFMGIVENF